MSLLESTGTAGADRRLPTSTAIAAATTSSSSTTPPIANGVTSPASHPSGLDATAAAIAAAAAANKTRRTHRKSRNGCAECKRRHIRCDEHRPVCSNCTSADRTCIFPKGPGSAAAASGPSPGGGVSKSTASPPASHHPSHHHHHQPAASQPPTAGPSTGTATSSPRYLPSPAANSNTPPPAQPLPPNPVIQQPRPEMNFEDVCGRPPLPGTAAAAAAGPSFRRSNYTYYPNPNGSSIDTAPPTPQALGGSCSRNGTDADDPTSASTFTSFHLQILHHMHTVMVRDPAINTNNHFQQVLDIAMRHATDAPYLINEMLAISAVHLATQKENHLYQQQLQQQQQQQQQHYTQQYNDRSASTTPAAPSHHPLPAHAPAILPPLLPPHGSPSSTASPASSSVLPSVSSATSTTTPPTTTPTSYSCTANTLSPSSFSTNPQVANLRNHATELQTRAVASFSRLTAHLEPDDTATCIPRFLFSSTLSMHALADSLAELRAVNADFHGFIDRFVDCFNLYRGIRAVIYPTWRFLSDSELRPLLQVTHEANLGIVERGNECAPLLELLCRSDLAPTSLEACRVAVEKLQWAFDLHNNLPPYTGQHAVSAFSVIVSAEYVDVLRKHRPEALIILSYFAVLLHRCRQFWIFQDSGACMIKAIANHIGSYWRDAMAWPLQVIETEGC